MTSDLHLHPLGHKYFFSMTEGFSEVVLDEEDKKNIRDVVDWCCHVRRLDAIALTDHDMIQASLYAAEYVREAALPIEIVTGAECSVRDPRAGPWDDEVHLLCLGIGQLPRYGGRTPVEKMIGAVREMGGFVIMSHPVQYPDSFFRYCHLLDGYEYRNGNKRPFDEGMKAVDLRAFSLRAFNNSDFHYDGAFPDAQSNVLQSNGYENGPLKG